MQRLSPIPVLEYNVNSTPVPFAELAKVLAALLAGTSSISTSSETTSVTVLLLVSVSFEFEGLVIVAVLTKFPVKVEGIFTVTVYVIVPLTGIFTASLIAPVCVPTTEVELPEEATAV